ncbi:MAG TPA: DUF3293 domain-containing protein [Gemmatimonadaceae bacterium]|nr:DUF3293 domain-containing protein [Gemmatimonadaceae bacterium]
MRPADDPNWSRYPETILEFYRRPADGEPAVRVDLRRPVPPGARERLAELGLDGPFGVVTAAAPLGEPQADAFDRAREADLELTARAEAHAFTLRVDGVSPDGAHRERSLAVKLPRARVVGLARDFGQSAVFWYDGRDFWLVGALVEADPQRLPSGDRASAAVEAQ